MTSFPGQTKIKFGHENKLVGLRNEELERRLIEAEEELAKAGITIDLEAKELVARSQLLVAEVRNLVPPMTELIRWHVDARS